MRRHSDSDKKGGRRGKIPILVSVELRNLCPKSIMETRVQSQSKKWFRPEHAMSLLHQVRLEIVIVSSGTQSDENSETKEEKVIFSSLAPIKTLNPSWNHLDECIEDYLALDGYVDSETSFYRFMRLRIWLLSEKGDGINEASNKGHDGDSHGNGRSTVSAEDTIESTPKAAAPQPLLDISIHPRKLRHLATIPPKLPTNSLILHFSDGKIRATRSLLDLVGDQDGSHADEHNKDEFGRFGDDVFRTLDSVTPVKKSSSSKDSTDPSGDPSLLASSYSEDSQEGRPKPVAKTTKKQQQELVAVTRTKFLGMESDATIEDVETERQQLERLIKMEEDALEEDLLSLQTEKSKTQSLLEDAARIEANITKLEGAIKTEKQLCRKSEFFLEARRMKLLHDLRNIYPISFIQGEDRYSIRDLRIPMDIHSGVVTDEELSAALGFLCHLVSIISKYLSVQLRYRLFCNSSRSAVQEDGGAIFPLFQARVVERDQLDHGVLLLRRNVECILKTRQLDYKPRDHILVNVKRLFDDTMGEL